ncbi:hypothetical protein TNCV_2696941 [Trichonephila clavipes]|nr:hypothetical protein TNCV_2696941 [Trichonephila clavipes]
MMLLRQNREQNESLSEGEALDPGQVGSCLKTSLEWNTRSAIILFTWSCFKRTKSVANIPRDTLMDKKSSASNNCGIVTKLSIKVHVGRYAND